MTALHALALHRRTIETIGVDERFYISGKNVLRQFKGFYFLNTAFSNSRSL